MRTRKGNKTALALAAAGMLLLGATSAQAADISVGSTTIAPDSEGSVTVTLNVESGETAVGTLTDVEFDPGAAVPARMGAAALLAENITADDTAIPVTDASDLQAFGTVTIDPDGTAEVVAYGRIDGNTLVAGGCTGGSAGNTPCLDDTECDGGTCEPSGRGQVPEGTVCPGAAGCPAAHDQGVAVATGLIPDCQASGDLASIMKDAVFSYLPEGCTPGTDCDTVRGIVIALDNLTQFPEGMTDLFSCTIATGATEGMFPLVCADGQVSDQPDGSGLIQDGPCTDGEVNVSVVTNNCIGDCRDPRNSVSIGEVQNCINLLLQIPDTPACDECDRDTPPNGVTIGEVQAAINNLLQLDPNMCVGP